MGSIYRRKPSGPYHGEYTDETGKRVRKSTGTKNRQDAQRILAKWEADANAIRQGVTISAKTTLDSLLVEYLAYMQVNPRHREETEAKLRRVIDACGFTTPTDITRISVETAVRHFRNLSRQPPRCISLQTQNHYLTVFRTFTRWLVELRHALPRDPLMGLRKPSPSTDRRLIRRFLLPDEWHWLKRTSPNALLYETAIQTGFRSTELRNIQPHHLHDDHILLPPNLTKNRLQAKQYIAPELSARLRGKLPFTMPDRNDVARTLLYPDLAAARAAWESAGNASPVDFLSLTNAAGHKLDFHSLRHTCGAWLAQAGVNAKLIQTVMRHSTITLTLDRYGHLMPGAESDAAAVLAGLLNR